MNQLPEIKSEEDYDKVYKSSALRLEIAHTMLKDTGIQHSQCEVLKGGSNLIYKINHDRILKLYPPIYQDDAAIERDILKALQHEELGAPAPRLYTHGTWRGWFYMVMSYEVGLNIIQRPEYTWPAGVTSKDRHYIISQLADWMQASYESNAVQSVTLPEKWESWPDTALKLRENLLKKHSKFNAEQAWIDQIEPFFEDFDLDACMKLPTYNVHADIHGLNVLISDKSGRWEISCVLDFADTLKAPIIYDLIDPVLFIAQGDPALCKILYDTLLGTNHGLNAKTMMQWALLHRFCNLGFFTSMYTHTKGKFTTIEELGHMLTGLN